MQLIWADDTSPTKDINNNYQIESSRTADSYSHIYQEDIFQKEDIENSEYFFINNKNYESDELTNKMNDKIIQNNYNIFTIKKRLSIILCSIYYILFLITIPKVAEKIGEEQNLNILIKNNSNKKINILIKSFNFLDSNKYQESTGFLLEFRTNKMYIFRWSIGFFYFIIKCICFVYSNNVNNSSYLLNINRINIIKKISMIFFPLSLFYFDLKNNIAYTEIKFEKIDNIIISYYAMTIKHLKPIDYIEGLIPTFFHFLISINYDNLPKNINTFIIKRIRFNKLV